MVEGFSKPPSMRRGDAGRVVIVGKGPGKTEIKKGEAFSGQAGKRLEQWLARCVPDPKNVRAAIYFTSVTKCLAPDPSFPILLRNCWRFLDRQIAAIQPNLIVSLGQEAYDALTVSREPYSAALCKLHDSTKSLLLTRFGFHYRLMVWPHPSGLNRWLNDSENVKKLDQSFELLRPLLAELIPPPTGNP